MIGQLVDRLMVTTPGRKFGQAFNNQFYNHLHKRVEDDVLFMNWCYEETPPMGIKLDPEDEPNRYAIQLYHAVAKNLKGHVLEIGCGRGGGASYLTRTFQPATYLGVDINEAGIEFCRRAHHIPGLEFIQGDAQNLPAPDESFDTVINIESSHCYPHFETFLREVRRVLKPGGSFLYADVRRAFEGHRWHYDLTTRFHLESWREINAEVQRGMELDSEWEAVADQITPGLLKKWGRRGVPGKGTAVWDVVAAGKISYRIYHLTKP